MLNSSSAQPLERHALRRAMRQRRRQLSRRECQQAARQVARMAKRVRLLRPGMRVAAYVSYANEVDLQPLLTLARRLGCSWYLPRITGKRAFAMQFLRLEPGAALRKNHFGIAEPLPSARRIGAQHLDLVFVPLVAFDDRGSRLGSGAGFYDRRFRFLRPGRRWRRPKLVGVAYDFQRVARLPAAPWDVPLDAVITEARVHRFRL